MDENRKDQLKVYQNNNITPLNVIHGMNVCGGFNSAVAFPMANNSSSPT